MRKLFAGHLWTTPVQTPGIRNLLRIPSFAVYCVFGCRVSHIYDRLVENEKQRTRGILNQIADIQTAAVSSWVQAALGDATGIR
jgi:hypothetical protein